MELHKLSIKQLNNQISSGDISTQEVRNYFLDRIQRFDEKLNSFLTKEELLPVNLDTQSSISGVPFAVKDNLAVIDHSTRAASKILEGYSAPYTATAVENLVRAGGMVLGRTNMDEFGMGSSTENSGFKPSSNPWNTDYVPGGSSGGSAAAVAAGLIPYALGSDTGGSIRQPASFCGIVGIKPTYGRVSRYGLLALASSLDCVGTLTKNIEDAALVLEYLAGHDVMDATTVNKNVSKYSDFLNKGVKGMKIGVPKEYFEQGLNKDVEKSVKEAIKSVENLGAEIIEVSLPSSKYGLAAYYIILPVEASANLSRYDSIKYGLRAEGSKLLEIYQNTRNQGFGAEVKRRIMLGTFASSSGYYDAYYKQALSAQNHIKREFKQVFEQVDALIAPITPTTAFKKGEKVDDPLKMYLNDVYTVTANIAGIPSASIPVGLSDNMPVGMQIMAPWFSEETIFQIAGAYEQENKSIEKINSPFLNEN